MKYAYSVIATKPNPIGGLQVTGNIGFVEASSEDEATGKAMRYIKLTHCKPADGWGNHNSVVAPVDQECVDPDNIPKRGIVE